MQHPHPNIKRWKGGIRCCNKDLPEIMRGHWTSEKIEVIIAGPSYQTDFPVKSSLLFHNTLLEFFVSEWTGLSCKLIFAHVRLVISWLEEVSFFYSVLASPLDQHLISNQTEPQTSTLLFQLYWFNWFNNTWSLIMTYPLKGLLLAHINSYYLQVVPRVDGCQIGHSHLNLEQQSVRM